jgi:uncharacterized RDD family membrane protein YckC
MYRLAPWWRRAVAAIIDFAIVAGVPVVVATRIDSLPLAVVVGVALFLVLSLLYAPLVMARTNGQTLGKLALRVRVIRPDGQPMDLAWSAFREVGVKGVATVLANSVTFGLAMVADYLWPLWDEENRALHDKVCRTRVVRARVRTPPPAPPAAPR